MKCVILSIFLAGTAFVVSSCATRNHAARTSSAADVYATAANGLPVTLPGTTNDPWPMTFADDGASYTVFEPQCDSWDGHQFAGRCAVAVQPAGETQPVYGVMSFSAMTLVDKNTRTATLANIKLTSSDFPPARDQTQNYLVPVLIHIAKGAPPVPLDHLEDSLTLADTPKPEPLNNAPPKIIVSQHPVVLVYIDGPPAWRPVAGTDLQRAINTRMLLLKDKANQNYLHLFDGYVQAPSLHGPWTVASAPPAGADIALKQAADSGQVDLMQGLADTNTLKEPSLNSTAPPEVYVATQPAELITFNGPPDYASIPGTDLLYASNTSGNVFKRVTDQQNYILISGRWYRSASLNGPWKFVPGNQLPQDFANIPDDSPKENVKASVPGTRQAEEALIANSIPQSTAIPRTTQMAAPQIDGAPQLAPITGTPLHYVVNSATPIIEVDSQSWYACQDGVWYAATSDSGPWTAAASVPAVIYTIPPDSPLHYLTYVQVYDATPNAIYEGYTPGYFGTEVCADGTVVYGTGYYYEPWIGAVWYGPPVTWGCGFAPCWTPWWGWGYNCGFGWGWGWGFDRGFFPPYPWWCGFRDFDDFHHRHDFDRFHGNDRGFAYNRNGNGYSDRRGWANTGANVYHRQQNNFDGHHFAASGFTGATRQNDFGRAYNSRTGQLAAGQRAHVPRVSGSAWNPGHPAEFANAANANRWTMPSRSMNWSGPKSQAFGGGRSFPNYSQRGNDFYAMPRGNAYPGPRGGMDLNNFYRGGGGVYHGGEMLHGGGGSSHGGGGGSFHGGGGGGSHGAGGGGGFHGGGGGGGGGGKRQ